MHYNTVHANIKPISNVGTIKYVPYKIERLLLKILTSLVATVLQVVTQEVYRKVHSQWT